MKKKKSQTDIKSSPYAVAALLLLAIFVAIGVIVWLVLDIENTKEEIKEVRASYAENISTVSYLEELRAKSEEAEQKLAYYEGILPADVGDAYVLEEKLVNTMKNFNLTVTASEDVSQSLFNTQETLFTFTVEGKYSDIMSFMQYISNLTQIHRFDSLTLSKNDKGDYIADMKIAVLSQNGATGVLSGVVE